MSAGDLQDTPVPRAMAQQAAELLPDGVVAAEGPGAIITHINRHSLRITGMRAEELVGRDLREALPFQDRAGESWWEIASPWEGLSTRTGHREKLLVLPTGKEVLVTSRYLRRGRGLPVVAVVVGLRDAEARRRAEADSAALLTTVAHELRSPLTGVKGFSSTLLRNWDRFTDDQKRMMIETIEADADRVTRLITELLDVSRIHAGRLRVHPQPVQVHEVYEREVARRSATGAARERFTIDLPEDLPAIWADPDRLDQIVSNLVENAVRHGRGQVRCHPLVCRGDRGGRSDDRRRRRRHSRVAPGTGFFALLAGRREAGDGLGPLPRTGAGPGPRRSHRDRGCARGRLPGPGGLPRARPT
jgi:signal transduction histidine kinase